MCNKHGTLDKRGRLWMYCDEPVCFTLFLLQQVTKVGVHILRELELVPGLQNCHAGAQAHVQQWPIPSAFDRSMIAISPPRETLI